MEKAAAPGAFYGRCKALFVKSRYSTPLPFGNVGGYLGPFLTGVIKDWTKSFDGAYLFLAASLLTAGLLMLTLRKGQSAANTQLPQ